jgi:hypothetical protein
MAMVAINNLHEHDLPITEPSFTHQQLQLHKPQNLGQDITCRRIQLESQIHLSAKDMLRVPSRHFDELAKGALVGGQIHRGGHSLQTGTSGEMSPCRYTCLALVHPCFVRTIS